jgi:Putative bacterial sensory transduction regulator
MADPPPNRPKGQLVHRDRIVQQVHGILAMSGIQPHPSSKPEHLLIPVPDGSSAVFIRFHAWGADTIISLSAPVLTELTLDGDMRAGLFAELNRLNARSHFGKFFLDADAGQVVLEYDILGDYLESEELLNALLSVGRLADDVDDELQAELGEGKRAMDVLESLMTLAPAEHESETHGDDSRN